MVIFGSPHLFAWIFSIIGLIEHLYKNIERSNEIENQRVQKEETIIFISETEIEKNIWNFLKKTQVCGQSLAKSQEWIKI